jgi:uroporphyrinogen decarboxylase
MYMKLFYLRGFENLMMDLATEDPRLLKVIEMVENYNSVVVNKLIELGAEYMGFGEDLGMQHSLPMSPKMWRKYIKPSYDRIFKPCRDADIPVFLHSDGKITEIIPDLIEVGVKILNPQIRANGLKGLQETAKGKVALLQDLDRQLFPFASPAQIEDHISEVYEGLYLPEGGLMLYAECEPDIPLENIEAICTTFEKVCKPPETE